jgi:hypothetical protein
MNDLIDDVVCQLSDPEERARRERGELELGWSKVLEVEVGKKHISSGIETHRYCGDEKHFEGTQQCLQIKSFL